MSSQPISKFSERELIEIIRSKIKISNMNVNALPHPEDAVALPALDYKFIVVNSDSIVESSDKPKAMPYHALGWKSVISSISDVAAKGAKPITLILNMTVKLDMLFRDFEELINGIGDAVKEYNLNVCGGDLNTGNDNVIDVITIGVANRLMTRSKLKEGYKLYSIGEFGYTGIALDILSQKVFLPKKLREQILRRFFYPEAYVEEGVFLGELGVPACIDCSDGLVRSLYDLSNASGFKILLENIPIPHLLQKALSENIISEKRVTESILYSGEDYALIFAIPSKDEDHILKELAKNTRAKINYLGKVLGKGKEVLLKSEDGIILLKDIGWDPFLRL